MATSPLHSADSVAVAWYSEMFACGGSFLVVWPRNLVYAPPIRSVFVTALQILVDHVSILRHVAVSPHGLFRRVPFPRATNRALLGFQTSAREQRQA